MRGLSLCPKLPKFRFYLDENFPVPAGKFLKSKGHNVLHVTSKNKFRGLSDFEQIRHASKDKRILMALDKDFKTNANLSAKIKKSPGVILITSSDPNSEKIISILKHLLSEISSVRIKGKICRISIDKYEIKEIK